MDFSSSALSLFPLLGSQGPLSGITVDDNLASVFIFLFSADNDRGTKATEKLWEDKRSRTEMVGGGDTTVLQRESRPLSAATTEEGKPFKMKQAASYSLSWFELQLFFVAVNTVWKQDSVDNRWSVSALWGFCGGH